MAPASIHCQYYPSKHLKWMAETPLVTISLQGSLWFDHYPLSPKPMTLLPAIYFYHQFSRISSPRLRFSPFWYHQVHPSVHRICSYKTSYQSPLPLFLTVLIRFLSSIVQSGVRNPFTFLWFVGPSGWLLPPYVYSIIWTPSSALSTLSFWSLSLVGPASLWISTLDLLIFYSLQSSLNSCGDSVPYPYDSILWGVFSSPHFIPPMCCFKTLSLGWSFYYSPAIYHFPSVTCLVWCWAFLTHPSLYLTHVDHWCIHSWV